MIRLTDEQWERIRKHFPEEHIPDGRAGRKPIPTRHVLEAVLWILNTGAQCTCCRLLAAFNCERYRTCDLAYAAILSFIRSVFSIHPVAAVAECARAIAAAALAGRRRIDHHPFAWNMVCPPELPPGSRNLRLKQVRLHSPSQLLFRNRCHR